MCLSTIKRGDSVNKIIGDSSLEEKSDHNPSDVNEQLRIRIHLEHVENLIRNHSSLSSMKSNALDHLNEYWKKGQFPTHNYYEQQNQNQHQRLPRFIDHNGVHCAVGYIISKSLGFEHLPNEINAHYEYSFIDEIAKSNNSDLNKWMNMYEFNLNELAMIQPTYEFMRNKKFLQDELLRQTAASHQPPNAVENSSNTSEKAPSTAENPPTVSKKLSNVPEKPQNAAENPPNASKKS